MLYTPKRMQFPLDQHWRAIGRRERMAEEKGNPEQNGSPEPRPVQRRKYEKPSFRFERVFETMALACGKISPTEFQCRFNRKNS